MRLSLPLIPLQALFPAVLLLACAAPPQAPPPPPPELSARVFLADAEALFRAREYGRAMEAFQLVASEAKRQGDWRSQTVACAMAARCYSILGDLPQGVFWLERAQETARSSDPVSWSRVRLVAGIFQREQGQRDAATETFAELYTFCRDNGLEREAIDAAHHAAIAATGEGQVEWAHKGLAAAQAAGEERWQAILWNNLGASFEGLGRFEEMLEAYRKARYYHGRTGGEREELLADWAVGRALRLVGEMAEAEELQVTVLARAERRQAQDPKPGNLEWVGYARWELGEIAAAAGRVELARERLEGAIQALVDAGVERVWPEGLAELRAQLAQLEQR